MHNNNESPVTANGGTGIHDQNRADRLRYMELEAQRDAAVDDGDTAAAEALTDEMVELGTEFVRRNRRLGMKVASRWTQGAGSNAEDYEASALAALWQTFLTWDPHSATFGTWSRQFIAGDVRRQVALLERRAKYGVFVLIPEVRAATERLTTELGRTPSEEEIAAAVGTTASMVRAALAGTTQSLDEGVGGDDAGRTLGDTLAESSMSDADTLADLAPQLAEWRAAIDAAVADGLSDAAIADTLGIDARIVSWLRTDAATEMIDTAATSEGIDELVGSFTTHGDLDEEAVWLRTLRAATAPLNATQLALIVLKDDLHGAGALTFAEIRELTGIGREGARKAYNASLLALAGPVPVR